MCRIENNLKIGNMSEKKKILIQMEIWERDNRGAEYIQTTKPEEFGNCRRNWSVAKYGRKQTKSQTKSLK